MFTPSVQKWLGDIQPAWTMLEPASLKSLYAQPSPSHGPLRLAKDFTSDEINQSAVARNTRLLLIAASIGDGLKLTATGNLSRKVVSEMFEASTWPGLDKGDFTRYHRILNEPDFLPLFFVRHLAETAGLLHQVKGSLTITGNGRLMLEGATSKALQALLFHVAFWLVDLNYFGRSLPDEWPQRDIGVVLWSLSVSADQWQTPEFLAKLCTIATDDIVDLPHDMAKHAMEAKVLRPLYFFGLLERHSIPHTKYRTLEQYVYRKSPLFERFLAFNVDLPKHAGSVH